MSTVLTRQERRARTREQLLDAASRLFAHQGIQATSVEQIAAEAGYTRGAVYSNFADKDDLIVALLDRRVAEAIDAVEQIYRKHPEPEAFYRALHERSQRRGLDAEDRVLMVEFWLYALRNPAIRPRLAARSAARRAAIARVIKQQFADLGIPLPVDAETMATVVLAMDEGLTLHRQLDPQSHPPGLFIEALSDMLRGQAALARVEAGEARAARVQGGQPSE